MIEVTEKLTVRKRLELIPHGSGVILELNGGFIKLQKPDLIKLIKHLKKIEKEL